MLRVGQFATAERFRDYLTANYGPTIAVYRFIADDAQKVAGADRDLAGLGSRAADVVCTPDPGRTRRPAPTR